MGNRVSELFSSNYGKIFVLFSIFFLYTAKGDEKKISPVKTFEEDVAYYNAMFEDYSGPIGSSSNNITYFEDADLDDWFTSRKTLEAEKELKQHEEVNVSNLHYTSMESWRGYTFTAVCLRVCLSVCPALLLNKIPAERMNGFGCGCC